MTYGEIIKKLCKEKKVKISQLEQDCGFCIGFIRTQKDNISFPKLEKIADYLQVSPQEIIDIHNGVNREETTSSSDLSREEKYFLELYRLSDEETKNDLWDRLLSSISEKCEVSANGQNGNIH